MPDGIIHRAGRSHLGQNLRSRLGVKTRRTPLLWRLIVVFPVNQPGAFTGRSKFEDREAIEQQYRELEEELSSRIEVELHVTDRWMFRIAQKPEANRKNVLNLVFIIGGASPAKFDYFDNFIFGPGGSLPIFGGRDTPPLKSISEKLNPSAWPSIASHYENDTLHEWLDLVGDTNTVQDNSRPGHSTKAECSLRSHSYKTDYDPEFEEVKTDEFTADKTTHLPEMKERLTRSPTYVFWDPGPRPESQPRGETTWKNGRTRVAREIESTSELWMHWQNEGPPAPPTHVLVNPFTVHPADVKIGEIRTTSVSGRVGDEVQWVCSSPPFFDGRVYDFMDRHTLFGSGVTTHTVVGEEGVDQGHDSRETMEDLIKELVDRHGPAERNYRWTYSGQVNSFNLNGSRLKAAIAAG
jgi:hypothetical protein